jgi:hypothetical protein
MGFHGCLVEENIDSDRRCAGSFDVRVAADRRPGHSQQCIRATLCFSSYEVVLGGVGAEALAGFGPVESPFGVDVPGEDLRELDPTRLGEEPCQGPTTTVRSGCQVERAALACSFVAGEVTFGVGECFPHVQVAFELDVGQVDGVVEQHPRITHENLGVDAWVRSNTGHRVALGDTDGARACGLRPLAEPVTHPGGLDASVRLRPGQLRALLQEGAGGEVGLRPKRGAGIDHTSDTGRSSVDHAAELLHAGHELVEYRWFRLRDVELAERPDRRDRGRNRCGDAVTVGHRIGLVDGVEPGERRHRTRERSHRSPPRIQELQTGQRHLAVEHTRRGSGRRTHTPIMTGGCHRVRRNPPGN